MPRIPEQSRKDDIIENTAIIMHMSAIEGPPPRILSVSVSAVSLSLPLSDERKLFF